MLLTVNQLIKLLLASSLILVLYSCNTYKPGYINSPTFDKEDKLFVNLSAGSQFGANISYSPFKNWGVLVNASGLLSHENKSYDENYVDQDKDYTDKFRYKNYFYELATGFYTPISENFYIDLYAGYGVGTSGQDKWRFFSDDFTFKQEIIAFKANYSNVFLQSTLKIILVENLRFNLSGRMNVLNYEDFKYIYEKPFDGDDPNRPNWPLPPQNEINNVFDFNQKIAYQLGLGLEADAKKIIINAQLQLGIRGYEVNRNDTYFSVRPFSVFIGIDLPIRRLLKKN